MEVMKIVKKGADYAISSIQFGDETYNPGMCIDTNYYISYEPAFYYRINQGKYSGDLPQWYDNGSLKRIDYIENGVRNGLSKLFYESGLECASGYYVDGNRHGPWNFKREDSTTFSSSYNNGTFESDSSDPSNFSDATFDLVAFEPEFSVVTADE